ncbi:MAG: hypothetical protein JF584_15610 [Acidobacteria bacterium]|nr:hypothetical protein [Acidobacteriota bacterium]
MPVSSCQLRHRRKNHLQHTRARQPIAVSLVATGNWQLATGNWQLATGNWQLATGNWQLATGNWQLATGNKGPN